MYKGNRITTVIPAHNEERHIAQVIQSMPECVDHMIVVDDCSADDTLAAALATSDTRLVAFRMPSNQGVGGATIAGYRKALEVESDIIVKMDGDGQMPPEYLTALLDPLIDQGYDYSKGNRFLAAESLESMPRFRLLGNVLLTFTTKLASGYWHIFDPQNGYTAIKAESLRALDLNSIHKRFFFENDMLVHLNFFNRRVKDVAVPARYGQEESDLNPFKVSLTFPMLFFRRFVRRVYEKYVLRDFSPIALFLFFGAILFGWGSLFGIYLWIETAITRLPTPIGTIMLALLPLILGFQLLLQAIVLDIQETPK